MSIACFVSCHRTKLLGLAQSLIGAVIANLSYLQQFLKPVHFGVGMFFLGITTTLLGFFNDWERKNDSPPNP